MNNKTNNTITVTMNQNTEANGIELSFTGKPSASVRETLKINGFRWHNVKSVWYAKETKERLTFAKSLCKAKDLTADTDTDKTSKASKASKASEDSKTSKANELYLKSVVERLEKVEETQASLIKICENLTKLVKTLSETDKPKAKRKPKSDKAQAEAEAEADKAKTLAEAKKRNAKTYGTK